MALMQLWCLGRRYEDGPWGPINLPRGLGCEGNLHTAMDDRKIKMPQLLDGLDLPSSLVDLP